MRRLARALAAVAALTGLAVGPRYERPAVAPPDACRGDAERAAESFADLPWWLVFGDPVLQGLVREALTANRDLQAAASRVEQARAIVGATRAPLLPQAEYQGDASRNTRNIASLTGSDQERTFDMFVGIANLAWEIDVWGRVRRATEASVAELFAVEEIRRGVVLGRGAEVAHAHFDLLELDAEIEIARRTTESFRETLALFTRQFEGGYTSRLAVTRAQAALAGAAAAIPEVQRQIAARENALSVLLGRPPGAIARGAALDEARLAPRTPPGLPSDLLRRRPDIRRAEQALVAANARVGVAITDFFPRLGLTAFYGGQSTELASVFDGSGTVWRLGGGLVGPLFQGGALYYAYRGAEKQFDVALQAYEQTVLTALAEVADALASQQLLREVRREREAAVGALREAVRLALMRYRGGLATYYEVLEAQQQLFPAENALARLRRDELLAVVQLCRALGGGWQAEPPGTPGRDAASDFPSYPPGTGAHPPVLPASASPP